MSESKRLFEQLKDLSTEQRNPASMDIDARSSLEIVTLINDEDKRVALAVETQIPHIAKAVCLFSVMFMPPSAMRTTSWIAAISKSRVRRAPSIARLHTPPQAVRQARHIDECGGGGTGHGLGGLLQGKGCLNRISREDPLLRRLGLAAGEQMLVHL